MGRYSKLVTSRNLFRNWRIFVGDKVYINHGKDKGEKGKIVKLLKDRNRVVVEGKNLVKRNIPRQPDSPGGIITMESPIHVSNVQVVDPVTDGPVRIAWEMIDGELKRVGRGPYSSFTPIPIPEEHLALRQRKPPRNLEKAVSTTPLAECFEDTISAEETDTSLLAHAMKLLKINTRDRINYDQKNPAPKSTKTGLTKPQERRVAKTINLRAKMEEEKKNPKLTQAERRKQRLAKRIRFQKNRLKKQEKIAAIIAGQQADAAQQASAQASA